VRAMLRLPLAICTLIVTVFLVGWPVERAEAAQHCRNVCVAGHSPLGCAIKKRVCTPVKLPREALPLPKPDEQARRCLNDISNCTGELVEHVDPSELINACAAKIRECPEHIIKRAPARLAGPIVRDYILHLRLEANGRWKSIPDEFRIAFEDKFPEINLLQVRYATGINTMHGQAITIGNEIFFPSSVNTKFESGRALLLHELRHVVQYRRKGGQEAFISEYILHAPGKVIEAKNFNVHDLIGTERDAISFSNRVMSVYGRTMWASNKCDQNVKIAVKYWNSESASWVIDKWWNIAANQNVYLSAAGILLHSNNATFYWYAEALNGSMVWQGSIPVNIDEKVYRFRQQVAAQSDERLAIRMMCDNKSR
jgi:uncharacterized membrane protein